MSSPLSLRQRNRLATMRLVQEQAVMLIEQNGFDATKIEDIAEATGVSASTIFRQFGTKEYIVLWDEIDDSINLQLRKTLPTATPVLGFRDAMLSSLGKRSDTDMFLRRLRLIYSTPAIWAEGATRDRVSRQELADAFSQMAGRKTISIADATLAAACLAALDVALETWQSNMGKQNLTELISEAFEQFSASIKSPS
jgi:AcrR family transcriptional regulator